MMPSPATPSFFPISFSPLSETAAGWAAVPLFEDEDPGALAADPVLEADVRRALAATGFVPRRFESLVVPTADPAFRAGALILLGAGAAPEFTPEVARRLASTASLLARARSASGLVLLHRAGAGRMAGLPPSAWAEAWAEGATLAEFDPGRYKTAGEGRTVAPEAALVWPGLPEADRDAVRAAATRGQLVARCANLARDLVNEPGNVLPPRVLAERARGLAGGTSLRVDVLEEERLAELGMGLLLGVARGSQEPPRLIVIEHAPASAPAAPVLGLVGKGVTFDAGGISIKTAAGMDRMKDDMAGGAAVIAALRAIALLGLPIRVIGVVPAVENLPSGQALKPGDVVRGASGRTVEVIDTDAEGRLILGDALWYARQLGATHLVDIATLTGSCGIALGKTMTGLFGRPDDWAERVLALADGRGERAWRLPLFDDYRDLLKSEIADTINVGGRYGGSITAALFLMEFTGGLPWVHLDIAASAWNEEARPYLPKGPTGVGVRTLTALAAAMAGEG